MSYHSPIEAHTATALFTAGQCEAIIAACDSELARRAKPVPAWNVAASRSFCMDLREVRSAAIAVQDELAGHDGFETAHDDLQAALDEIDFQPLWLATASMKAVA